MRGQQYGIALGRDCNSVRHHRIGRRNLGGGLGLASIRIGHGHGRFCFRFGELRWRRGGRIHDQFLLGRFRGIFFLETEKIENFPISQNQNRENDDQND